MPASSDTAQSSPYHAPATPITVQPAALLVTAAATVTVETLNTTLKPAGLWLPLVPLEPGVTLAQLVQRNAGGRRRFAYGTIARYLRAATLLPSSRPPAPTSAAPDAEPSPAAPTPRPITLGGPTLKRATGYGLPRALVGGWLDVGTLLDLTLNLRPLPAHRHPLRLVCADLPSACQLATQLLAAGLGLSALAMLETADTCVLLAELEGSVAVIERQAAQVTALATAAHADVVPPGDAAWEPWEARATAERAATARHLDLSLPRATLPEFARQSRVILRRYGLDLPLWGDLAVGTLHLTFPDGHAGEVAQAAALVYNLARHLGGSLCTERGMGALAEQLWQHEARHRGIHGVPVPTSTPAPRRPPAPAGATHALIAQVQAVCGTPYVLTRPDEIGTYTQDASIAVATGAPLAVVLPASTAEVSAVLRLAHAAGVPVVTRGAGSGLAGGATPSAGSLLLVLTRMQRLHVDSTQMIAQVEGGTITADIQRAAEAHGLFYPPDPSSQGVSTIGGNIACNAGGPRCLKYGVTADYLLGLTAVLADGRVIRTGDSIAAQSPDAGLLHLLIGSEGTLAVITEATLRLIPRPAAQRTALAIFDQLDAACATVETMMASGLLPASLELMDATTIAVVADYLRLDLPRDAGALLLLLSDGAPEAVATEAAALAELAQQGGARSVQVARNAAEEASLWKARRAIAPALNRVRPNRLGEDICVPLPQIANAVRQIQQIATRAALPIAVFGHAGDGNLHPNILFDSRDPAQVRRTWQAAEAIFTLALELGGTLSGEHGIGTLKRPFLRAALGDDLLALQRELKAAFDPHGQLNPGKLLP